jgi:hypothetical protein
MLEVLLTDFNFNWLQFADYFGHIAIDQTWTDFIFSMPTATSQFTLMKQICINNRNSWAIALNIIKL